MTRQRQEWLGQATRIRLTTTTPMRVPVSWLCIRTRGMTSTKDSSLRIKAAVRIQDCLASGRRLHGDCTRDVQLSGTDSPKEPFAVHRYETSMHLGAVSCCFSKGTVDATSSSSWKLLHIVSVCQSSRLVSRLFNCYMGRMDSSSSFLSQFASTS
jgi:hypothetical protein